MAFEYQGFATLGVNLNRQKYGPLDISQVFTSQADLNYYTSKGAIATGVSAYWLDTVPYPYAGQIVALVADGEVSILYLSEKTDGTFETHKVGAALVGDGASVEVVDGTIQLSGIADLESSKVYQPVYKNGTLVWEEPSATTVEGLDTRLTAAEGNIADLRSDVDDMYTKDEVNNLVSGAFHFKGTATRLDEDGNLYNGETVITGHEGDVYQIDDKEYAYNGTAWIELGFTLDLSAYATTAALNKAKTDAIAAAAEDASTKADSAKEAAITAAATDATSKADAAQVAAEAYTDEQVAEAKTDAAADATTKADAALAAAKEYTNTQVANITDGLGDLAALDEVSEAELSAELAAKINAKADSTAVADDIATAKTELNNNIATAKAEAIESANATAAANLETKVGDIGDINVKTYVDNKATEINSTVSSVSTKVGTIESTIADYGDIVSHNASEFATATALAATTTTANEAKNKVDALEETVGTIPTGSSATTVIEYINKKTEGIATDSSLAELQAIVDANSSSIATLVGKTSTSEGDTGKSAREIAAEEVAKIVAGADAAYDTLKEIADYIASDIEGTVDLITKIDKNAADITTLNNAVAELANAEENVLESISVNGTKLTITEKNVDIPLALQASLGLVKGTDVEDGISIEDDHTMRVNSLNVNKLVQTEGDTLTLDGGSAAR